MELKSLFEISIEHVEEMLGDGDGFNFELIKQIFQNKAVDKRFCSVNATAIVEYP